MAKQIEPQEVWVNGVSKTAEFFQVTCINDNYENSATNYWQLFTKVTQMNGVDADTPVDVPGEQVAQGNLTISGQDYINWGDQPAMAINAWIYEWSAEQLNLTII
jgi:hypothetical protein